MNENLLDNMSGQEIKELIEDEIVSLQDLDKPALEKLLAFETEMLCLGSGDMNIIRQCSEILYSKINSDKLQADEISDIINKTKSEHITISDANGAPASAPRRKPHVLLKRVAIIAAAIIITMASTLVIAAAFGVDILGYLNQVVRQDKGYKIVTDDFTFYNTGEAKKYSSLEEMLEKEDLDILYPSKLPDGVFINKVYLLDNPIAEKNIHINTTDTNIHISILIQYKNARPFDDVDEVLTVNGIEFHIIGNYATCYHKGDYYSVNADNYDDLILIIKGFKE